MLLGEYMRDDLILCDLRSQEKTEVIEEIVDLFAKAGVVGNRDIFRDTIRKREELESTAIGYGVAIPHGRSDSVKELKIAFARSKNGVDFQALDKKPVYIIFMIAAPAEARKEYLQIVAKIARLSKSRIMREALHNIETPEEVMELIHDFDSMLVEDIKVKLRDGRIIHKE